MALRRGIRVMEDTSFTGISRRCGSNPLIDGGTVHPHSGIVEMTSKFGGAAAPICGMKQSGSDPEGCVWGLDESLEVKAVSDWE